MGPGNLQWDYWLFLSLSWTGPLIILKVGSTGPRLMSVYECNGAKDYFGVLQYEVIDYIQLFMVFLIVEIRDHGKYHIRDQQLFQLEISTGMWIIFCQADTGPYTFWDVEV